MAEGTVKFFNAVKQFGFINGDDGKSYYFHATQIEKGTQVNDGDRVSFGIAQGERGPRAEGVKKIGGDKAKASEEPEEKEGEESEEKEESESEEASKDEDGSEGEDDEDETEE